MSNSVDRALHVLELLAGSDKPLTLTRIAERLSIPKSTAHGIVRTLAARQYVEVTAEGSYTIGIKAFEVGTSFVRLFGPTAVITPQLVAVTRELEVTSHFAVLDGPDAVYLCKEDPPSTGVQLASALGARLPAHLTAVGKACLAWLPKDQVAAHVPDRRSSGDRTLAALHEELAVVRQRGFSTDDGATAAGIRCVAAPVFDLDGPRGAIGVSYLREAGQSNATVVTAVTAAAARATALLGGGRR